MGLGSTSGTGCEKLSSESGANNGWNFFWRVILSDERGTSFGDLPLDVSLLPRRGATVTSSSSSSSTRRVLDPDLGFEGLVWNVGLGPVT